MVKITKPLPGNASGAGDCNGGRVSAMQAVAACLTIVSRRSAPGTGRQRRRLTARIQPKILPADQSAALRDHLLIELDRLAGADDAAHWARRSLPEKAKLTAADEQSVEQAFQAKLATLAASIDGPADVAATSDVHPTPPSQAPGPEATRGGPRLVSIDKSLLALPEPRRLRDREHIRYVAKQPCLICGRSPCDAHHLRFAQRTALGRKVSDEFTVPLCRGHHRELHRYGDEAAWWTERGVDPTLPARKLWHGSHPQPIRPGEPPQDESESDAPVATPQPGKRGRSVITPGKNHKTRPIVAVHNVV
jgi:hypothetical protein